MKKIAKHIPNILTIFRFILIPFIVLNLANDKYLAAFVIFTVSGLTDILDGFIARKFNFITNFGKLIDPLADKCTQIITLATLALKNIIPMWIIIIVILKEFIMVAGASFLYGKELVVSSKWYGKLATVLFYIAIVCSLFIKEFNFTFDFSLYIYYLALISTIFSLLMYIKAFYVQGYLKKESLKINEQFIDKTKDSSKK
ncbi:MAG: CDP-diacylglycerol--glycerol-3-phosphate 3-phosphatidyltransferase [Clostridia bacterium]|jgi:CDP-diacylglycerol--glycerol-3-phosphate 3-phosphatidyltransferase|nr:CDP-diacylglycerol--glycerol-3-phosphate 3-phosphatidyltransferase [Clostridium sp.]MEE0127945.1 CDP-diacylglycerol--glycerol-3-phosphate 3-phosphatidyltransferase [Clostridia bacterium]